MSGWFTISYSAADAWLIDMNTASADIKLSKARIVTFSARDDSTQKHPPPLSLLVAHSELSRNSNIAGAAIAP
jgi:hypothetical protein